MSHFTVLVVGKDVEKQLAKYDERINVEPYVVITREQATKKLQKEIDKLREIVYSNDNEKWDIDRCKTQLSKLLLLTDEQYFMDISEDYDNHDKDGNPLATYNPDSKWDWYQIGGRWCGFFKMKKGHAGELGDPAWCSEDGGRAGYADQCLKKDIDIEFMRKEKMDAAKANWDEAFLKYPSNSKEDRTERYWHYGLSQSDEDMGKEKFVENAGKNAIVPFAAVKDGKWYEKGRMGFWAVVSDAKDNWPEEFNKIWDSIGDDETVTIVDCHI